MSKQMPKLYLGAMSKNIIDAAIEYSADTGEAVGLIPSRRQVDFNSGYANNWKTKEFVSYIRKRSKLIVIQRDHGGPNQGDNEDDGMESFFYDSSSGFDLIHIDPWKKYPSLEKASEITANCIKFCHLVNPACEYEIGTEQAIRKYESEELDLFLDLVRNKTNDAEWDKVRYAVIQSGTKLSSGKNTGEFDKNKLERMVKVCSAHRLLSKEHNGDYLNQDQIKIRFEWGLDSINVAPEIVNIESKILMANPRVSDLMFDECIASGRWEKWFPKGFDPYINKESVVLVCGHYSYSNPIVSEAIRELGLNEEIKKQLRVGIERILLCA